MLASFDTSALWHSKPTMQSIKFMVQCCAPQRFSSPNSSLHVTEMCRNNLEGLLLFLYPWDNKCTLDFILLRLGKLLCRRQENFLWITTVSENIWCVWLCTAMGVIFKFSRTHYTTLRCLYYAHYGNQQSIMSDAMCLVWDKSDWCEMCRLPFACRLPPPPLLLIPPSPPGALLGRRRDANVRLV